MQLVKKLNKIETKQNELRSKNGGLVFLRFGIVSRDIKLGEQNGVATVDGHRNPESAGTEHTVWVVTGSETVVGGECEDKSAEHLCQL